MGLIPVQSEKYLFNCTALVASDLGMRACECLFVCNKSHIWDRTQDVIVISQQLYMA